MTLLFNNLILILVYLRFVNTLRPRQNYDSWMLFLECKVSISIEISLISVPNDPIKNSLASVQSMACHRPGDKPFPLRVGLSTHIWICIIRPQWVMKMDPIVLHHNKYYLCIYELCVWTNVNMYGCVSISVTVLPVHLWYTEFLPDLILAWLSLFWNGIPVHDMYDRVSGMHYEWIRYICMWHVVPFVILLHIMDSS